MSSAPSSNSPGLNDNKREFENDNTDNYNKKIKLEGNDNVQVESKTSEESKSGLAVPKMDEKKKNNKKKETQTNTTTIAATPSGINKKKDVTPLATPPINTSGTNTSSSAQQKQKMDPNKMQDVLFSAGVDIREEEALLNSSINTSKTTQAQLQSTSVKVPKHPPFLHPDQVAMIMKRVARDQNFKNTNELLKNNDILNMMSTACETYMKDIITNALVISRHRRKAVQINAGRRSEVSIALRAIALQQKKDEERRVKKRIALGLEKEDYENKIDSEETLHRASNVTAGLRAGSKKQYGWLTSSVGKPTNTGVKSTGRVASDISARGENGLKYREAREEPGIVMRDLLNALENRRRGVHTVISKGYARIRD